MNRVKFIDDDLIVSNALVDLFCERHCISAANLTESVVQSRKEPHSLNVEISSQREPYEFIETKLCVAFELVS